MTAEARTITLRPATPAASALAPAAIPALSPVGLAAVLVGVLLPMVDFFIVNVALPTMARDLHASAATLELVVSGYATAYAVLLVVGGRLGDARGRRRMFLAGMVAFTVASLACGLAPTAWALVAMRVVQGGAAAAMVPQTLSTIQATGDAASRARALGWYGATGGIAAASGQVLGGLLVSADVAGAGWRPIFLVNVPIGVIGYWLAARHLPETRASRAPRPDLAGSALLAVAVVALLVPLTEGRALGWPVWSWLLLAAAPLTAGAFVVVERRLEACGREPLVPSAVLRHRSMRRGLALGAPFFAGFGAFMFVYALVVQDNLGYGSLTAGLALAPMALAFLAASLLMPRLVPRFGRTVITAGALVQLTGVGALALTLAGEWPHVPAASLAPALAVAGLGQGLVMPALIRVVLSEVPVQSAGAGSGVLTTMQQVSLAVGVASLGSLFVALSPAQHMGALGATLVVLAVQAAVAAAIAVGSRGLPHAGRR